MNKTRRMSAIITIALAGSLALAGCTNGAPSNLPSGMPDTVPVAQGDVSNQVSRPDQGNWSFSVTVKDEAAQKDAVTKMTEEGWKLVGESEGKEQSTYALSKGTQNASVLLTTVAGKPAVVYNVIDTAVTPAPEETPAK